MVSRASQGRRQLLSMQQICFGLIGVTLVIFIFMEVQKRTKLARFESLMGTGDYKGALALLERPIMCVAFPRYNLLFMRLNVFLAMDDAEASARVVEEMEPLRMSKEQELALAVKAFGLFVESENKARAHEMLRRIEELGPKELGHASRQTYEILLCGSSAYVKEMENALTGASVPDTVRLCQMLSLQYENRGDHERAAEYHARAEEAIDRAMQG